MLRVYVAGAYSAETEEQQLENVKYAIAVGNRIAEQGYFVYVPHQNYLWEKYFPHSYDFWMKQDIGWLDMCDVLVRLDNESKGADIEVCRANRLSLLVYTEQEFFENLPTEETFEEMD